MKIDLHTHSRVSDGTDTPTSLVRLAAQAGLDVIALTDHDSFGGIPEAMEAGKRIGVKVLCGIEMSTEHNGRSVHLLGYGCDPFDRQLGEELGRIRFGRTDRLPGMVEKLTEAGLPITMDDVMTAAGGAPAVGRPHVADALVAKGYVEDREEAFAKWLGEGCPGYVHRYAVPLERGIDLIHAAKGVAVIAHPWGRGNRETLPARTWRSWCAATLWRGSRWITPTTTTTPAPSCSTWGPGSVWSARGRATTTARARRTIPSART